MFPNPSSSAPFWDAPLSVEEFANPGARFRLAPFWFWNGAMDEPTVRAQVRAMHEQGVGGFFIHPRQGLSLPYLSDEFFARVRAAVEEAASLGMEAWLYDELPYPSGIAGGMLTANRPDLRARVLEKRDFPARGGEAVRFELPLGRLVCALAVPRQGGKLDWNAALDIRSACGVVLTRELFWLWPMAHIPYNEKRFMADEGRLVGSWTAPADAKEWTIFAAVECEQRGFKYFDCWFDPLHPDAAPEFLALTHERYARHVGESFGSTIPGIFSDETEPPEWSPHIEAACDFDLSQLAPALWSREHPRFETVRLAWRALSLRLFQDRWEAPLARWCEEHGLLWAAEKPTWRPAQFRAIAQPSTDAAHRRVDLPPEKLPSQLRANGRVAISAAEQSGTEEVRCECFHSLGWGATLQDQKWAFDWMAATGVNRFTPHAFYFSSSGLLKHDAAPSFFLENPYWKHFRALADYAARLGLAMSRGREVAPLALLHPTRPLWRGDREAELRLEEAMNALLRAHFGFHIADARSIRDAHLGSGELLIGRARYKTLIVLPFAPDDEETLAALERATQAKVRVIHLEEEGGVEPLLRQLERERQLSVCDADGHEIPSIWALWRQAGEQNLVFLANTSDQSVVARVRPAVAAKWQKWSLETGEVAPLNTSGDELPIELPAFGSALLVSGPSDASPPFALPRRVLVLPLDGSWNVRLDEPNALRLNRWQASGHDALDAAQPEFDDSSWRQIEALPLRFLDQRVKREVEAIPREPGGPVWYRRTVHGDFAAPDLELLVENGAILGDWSLWVNGQAVPPGAFLPRELHGSHKTACDLSSFWRVGSNVLALRVEGAPLHGGLRTPLHLIGSFGVETRGSERALVEPVRLARFNDLDDARAPHFAGTARFSRRLPASLFAGHRVLQLPSPFEDIAEVRLNGVSSGVRAWSPYEWNLPGEALEGEVELEIAVTGTLLRFLEGRVWNALARDKRAV